MDDSMRDSVVLIAGDLRDGTRGPLGTGFIVTVPSETDPSHEYGYVVTAWHVVRDQNRPEVWVRASGERQTVFLDHWLPHPDGEDLAAAPFVSQEDARVFSRLQLHEHSSDAAMVTPHLGTTVYFIGLLEPATEMSAEGIPMVRTGAVGALDQPIEWEGLRTRVHLVDVRSFRGFSGSPVFIQSTYPGPSIGALSPLAFPGLAESERQSLGSLYHWVALWGVLVAHFDEIERAEGRDTIRLNVGVGVVLPVARVRELLYQEELVELRRSTGA